LFVVCYQFNSFLYSIFWMKKSGKTVFEVNRQCSLLLALCNQRISLINLININININLLNSFARERMPKENAENLDTPISYYFSTSMKGQWMKLNKNIIHSFLRPSNPIFICGSFWFLSILNVSLRFMISIKCIAWYR
jgi:hypothetical protein